MKLLEHLGGQTRGVVPTLVRGVLSSLTPIYRLAIAWRNWKFDRALDDPGNPLISTVPVPVISIGNLTTGGTGKTPHVIKVSRWLRDLNLRVAVISRGYGAENISGSSVNDEALEMEHRLPDVPQLQDPDRSRMAQIAVEELEAQVLVLDDGFQHRRLARDLDIVIVDATLPFGFGRLLPRGLLREPIRNLRRADLVILSRSDLVDDAQRQDILRKLKALVTADRIAETKMTVTAALPFAGDSEPIDKLQRRPTLAFSGIGNPANFLRTLEANQIQVVDSIAFPDHHGYERTDLERIAQCASTCGAEQLVCTHKDLVKLGVNQIGGLPLRAILIEVEFIKGESQILSALNQITATRPDSAQAD